LQEVLAATAVMAAHRVVPVACQTIQISSGTPESLSGVFPTHAFHFHGDFLHAFLVRHGTLMETYTSIKVVTSTVGLLGGNSHYDTRIPLVSLAIALGAEMLSWFSRRSPQIKFRYRI